MKASVVFSRTDSDSFVDFRQKFEGVWGEEDFPEAFKSLTKVLNIRLQRAVKNLSDDDIRDMWDEVKTCIYLDYDIFEKNYDLPMRDIYLSLLDVTEHFADIQSLCYDLLAILFELDDGRKILMTFPGTREKFAVDDTVECLGWDAR